jgi:DIM1 family U5 snRNP protein
MSYLLPHLYDGWEVDQAILQETNKLVVIRFGHEEVRSCMQMDEMLYQIAYSVQNFAVIYLVDIGKVEDFNNMYELFDPFAVMFFYRNKHIMVDFGTGNNNKLNFMINDKQELIDILEVAYRAATKGRGLAVSPIDYSTKHKY